MGWRGFGPWRREFRAFVELFALTGVAVAQPTFDLLSKNASLMVTLRTTEAEAVLLTLIVLLGPPVALWLLEVLAGLAFPRARAWVHAVLAASVVAVIGVEVAKHQTELGPAPSVVAAAVVGIAAAIVIRRSDVVCTFLRFLAIAPPVFAILFLTSGQVSDAVFDAGPASASIDVGRPKRVVMVVLDELPLGSLLDGNGHIDATLFPHIAALAGDATWYRNSTTVAPNTEHAVPALVSGTYPTDQFALPVSQAYPHNLFTLLGNEYEMNVHETLTRLCPRGTCPNPEASTGRRGLGNLLHDTALLWHEFVRPSEDEAPVSFDASAFAGGSAAAGRAFVSSLEPSSEPRLDFLHILLPHQPWHLRAGDRDDGWRRRVRGMFAIGWASETAAQAGRQRHLLQLQATDELVGKIVARLRRIGVYRDSLVVLTADHGIAFAGGSRERGLDARNWPQIVWTPLLVKAPNQAEGHVDDRPARSIDVVPTIADLLDLHVPWPVDGRSLLRAPQSDGPRRVFEWWANALKPPPGNHFVEVDGTAGFASVIASRAATGSGPGDLRLYQLGAHGDLVGQRAAPHVDRTATPSVGRIVRQQQFAHVDRDAKEIPWAYVHGYVRAGADQPIAVTVNGVVAGTGYTLGPGATRRAKFWVALNPEAFVDGKNDVRLYLVGESRSSPVQPQLSPVQLR